MMIQNVLAFSEAGAVRSENQDAVCAAYRDRAGIFAIADGMGGHFNGGMASAIGVAALQEWWAGIQDSIMAIPFFDAVSSLERTVHKLNRQIYEAYLQEGQQGGTTLCLLFMQDNSYAVLNVGDSRLYFCDRRRYQQISVDDVWENKPDIRSLADKVDLSSDQRFGRLTNALGVWEQVSISVSTGVWERDAVFFLCSDGVYKYYAEKRIAELLKKARKHGNEAKVLERIREGVYKNGAEDNLSAVLVHTKERNGLL